MHHMFSETEQKKLSYADMYLPLQSEKDPAGLYQTSNKGRHRKISPLGNPLL